MTGAPGSLVDRAALIDAATGAITTYGDLDRSAAEFAAATGQRGLVFLFGDATTESIIHYRSAIAAGHAIALLDATLNPDFATALVERYRPDLIVSPGGRHVPAGYRNVLPAVYRRSGEPTSLHPDLAILLTTSGSTGSPKFVRLSRGNIDANTRSIIESLSLTGTDRAITTLPLFYSYGMSVINTHLAVGGAVVVTDASMFEGAFWDAVREHRVTILNGVPSTFAMLKRLRLERMELPSLRAVTQAGGKLAVEEVERFADIMAERGGEMYVMYGQTEAAPRIACRGVNGTRQHVGSAGVALAGGQLSIVGEDGRAVGDGVIGEVRYRGPNVMMGYAERPDDLQNGDQTDGVLLTGDLGRLEDGFLYITGRTKRIAKVSGVRISLDEVEALVAGRGPVAAVPGMRDDIVMFTEWGAQDEFKQLQRQLCADLNLPPKSIELRRVDTLPVMSSGKVDYRRLQESLEEEK
ncbi:AMP-binding protein [Blastococcus sp. Marseille-P5729]|uniref:AMP-binding protein n=1 Tax=Blastococcus sp. Marseille-P5729 TaxID=2086582 RepID=UPI000D0EEDAD|nr:AMP-binding protein [Blastococcus sp. Marseille-P5729]